MQHGTKPRRKHREENNPQMTRPDYIPITSPPFKIQPINIETQNRAHRNNLRTKRRCNSHERHKEYSRRTTFTCDGNRRVREDKAAADFGGCHTAGVGWEGGVGFEADGERGHYGAQAPGDGEVENAANCVAGDDGAGGGGEGFNEVGCVHLIC